MAHCYKHKHISDEDCPYCEIERWKKNYNNIVEENVTLRSGVLKTSHKNPMTLEEKNKYISDHLMDLSAETLRFMVVDLIGG